MEEELRNPTVSVIAPFHNRAVFLGEIVATVCAQTYSPLELVVVDDASTDGLADAVAALDCPVPVRFVRLETNRGAASARNAGLAVASGALVAFLDSDDAWAPGKIAAQVACMRARDDWMRLVSLTRQRIRGRAVIAPRRLMSPGESVGGYLFLRGGVIQSSTIMLARDFARQVRFEEGGGGHDDWTFALRLEEAGAVFEMLNEPLTIYDDGADRPRRSPAYAVTRFEWLDRWRSRLGDRAYWAACATVASRLDKGSGTNRLAIIARAWREGAIGPARAAYYGLALVVPPVRTLATAVRERVDRWRSGPPLGGGKGKMFPTFRRT